MKPHYEVYNPTPHNPEDARPDCMNAYRQPSVENGVRIDRKAPSNQCTGKLKDNKDHTR